MPELKVTINGTGKNPWHRFGLSKNPFPQLGKAEWVSGEMQVASLDGDPVTGPEDIRARLSGFSAEFVNLCVNNWEPGKRVRFLVTWPDD